MLLIITPPPSSPGWPLIMLVQPAAWQFQEYLDKSRVIYSHVSLRIMLGEIQFYEGDATDRKLA